MKYLITGTSSGLGFCLANKLLESGEVVGISRSYGKANLLVPRNTYTHIIHDFSSGYKGASFISLVQRLNSIVSGDKYTLVLNASAFYYGSTRLDCLSLEHIFSVNVFSIIQLFEFLDKTFLERVLIVNSVSGLIGQSNQHEYCSTKHAIMGFARSLIKSAKGANYDVMCINPGGIKTELWRDYCHIDTSDFLDPQVVANLCCSLLSLPGPIFIESMTILPVSDI